MALVLAERGSLPCVQQRELSQLEPEVRMVVSRLRAHPLLQSAVLAELLGSTLAAFVERQLRYGPPASAAPCNVANAGFGGV